jgi:hypothetical protein
MEKTMEIYSTVSGKEKNPPERVKLITLSGGGRWFKKQI